MTDLEKTAEIVIIGGGVIGCSIAYHLACRGCADVVLLEREHLLGAGSTGRNAGGVRHQFSTETNIRLSIESIKMIENFSAEMDCETVFHQDGYLFLLSSQEQMKTFQKSVELQRSLGVPVEILPVDDIPHLIGGLNLDGIVGATYCAKDGIAEPASITQGYAKQAKRLGARIYRDTEVTGIKLEGSRVAAVQTNQGEISTRVVVNAAGPWARQIGEMVGLDIPVLPFRRHIFTTHPFPATPRNRLMVIDFATTFYFHREGGGVLMGMSDKDEPSSFNQSVNWEFFDSLIEVATRRFPALADAQVANAWAGLYEMTPDANPILGRVSAIEGLILANGFSGHGFQHAPAVGKLIAEVILDGKATTIDISEFAYERFSGRTINREVNVV